MMKNVQNIIKSLIFILLFAENVFSQDLNYGDITVTLSLRNTGWFTYNSWEEESDLWEVEIKNNTPDIQEYRLYFELNRDGVKVMSGLTPIETLDPLYTLYINNKHATFNDPSYLYQWYCDSYDSNGNCINNFEEQIKTAGGIPPGSNYELKIQIVRPNNQYYIIDTVEETMNFVSGDAQFTLQYPENGEIIDGSNFYFQWDSPGFRSGVLMEFRLVVAAIVPGESDNAMDAIDMGGSNSVYFYDSAESGEWEQILFGYQSPTTGVEWPYEEVGYSRSLNSYYMNLRAYTQMDPLVCGYQYGWRIEAREAEGIWGADDPVGQDVVRDFTFGDIPDGLISPLGDNVLPTFNWDGVWCAETYDIEISTYNEDFGDYEGFILSEVINGYQYSPNELFGLIPSQRYYWRVRVYDTQKQEKTPWTSYATFQMESIELSNPENGGYISTVRPEFDIIAPNNIAHFRIMIGDENDKDVEIAEIYDREHIITDLPWKYKLDVENGLFPGNDYWWKLLMYDGNDNILGEIENYNVWNFRILPIILSEPADKEVNIPLNQMFTWDGPDDVYKYELWLSDEDPYLENPKVIIDMSGREYYNYPYDGEFPLDYETKYYWRLIPKDANNNYGPASSYSNIYQFTTTQFAELIGPLSGSIIETVRPTFEINTPSHVSYITLRISDETDEAMQDPKIYNEKEKIYPSSTDFVTWQYPSQDIEYGLHPGMKYYWQYLMYDDEENLIDDLDNYEINFFTIQDIALQVPEQSAKDIPLNPTFRWDAPIEVSEYEFWLSGEDDPELENPAIKYSGIIEKTFEYPESGDFLLEYDKIYYWRVISKDVNGNLGLISSYTDIFQFSTSGFPEMGEDLSVSNADPRIFIVNVIAMEGIEYTIFIYSDSEGNNKIEELTGITTFPYEYTSGKENLQYGTTYYIQVQPLENGEDFGPPSNMLPFSIPDEPENFQQCEISCSITENVEPEILTTILEGIEGATEYLLLLSENDDMSNPIKIVIPSTESQYLIPSEYVDWGGTYYTQVVALAEDEELGLPSSVQMVSVESKPGMDEKTAISINLSEGSVKPTFEIINEITAATGYRIFISTESDMSVEFWQFDLNNSTLTEYPSDGPLLQFGQSYYVTAQALQEDALHGIVSNSIGFYIPNITPPQLNDAFNWEASIPPAEEYLLEVSLIEDFSAVVISKLMQGNSYAINMDELDYSKGYYWRIQGLSSDGESFGNPSQIGYFETEPIPDPVLNTISEEVPLNPEFSWIGIEMTTNYQITISMESSLETILWQENISGTSAVYPESATLLNFASTYFWQVIAIDDNDVPLSKSSIESFSTLSVYPVVGLAPNGGTENLTPNIQWEANDKIPFYLVLVYSDLEMQNNIISEQVDNNSFQVSEGIFTSGITYYWIIDGLDENGESLAGFSETALLTMPSLSSLSLISPIGDELVSNLTPTLKWSGLLGVESYTLRIGTDPDFESIIANLIVSNTEINLSEEYKLNNATTYFWQVEGATEDNIITSQTGSFSTPESSEIIIQTLEDGESISITNPLFSWEADEGIAAFSIRFASNADFSESWNFKIGATSFEYPQEPPLEFDTPYYWQVSPLDNEGNSIGDWTPARNFSISAAFIVTLELPGNGEIPSSSNPRFQWSALESVTKYEIQVSNSEEFSELLWTSSEIIENNIVYPKSGAEPLEYGQTYFWRVRALGEDNPLGDYSSLFSFDLSGANKLILEGPIGTTSETLLPYFSWEPVSGAKGYMLSLASDESISTIIFSGEATEVFLQYPDAAPPLSNGTTYYWNVFAKDDNGNPLGDVSDIGSFSTPSGTIKIEFMFGNE